MPIFEVALESFIERVDRPVQAIDYAVMDRSSQSTTSRTTCRLYHLIWKNVMKMILKNMNNLV